MTQSPRPAPPVDLLVHARARYRAGDLQAAESTYRAILQTSSHDVDALSGLGACLAQAGRNAEAIEVLQLAIEQSVDFAAAAPALANLSNALQACGRLDEALAAVDMARLGLHGNLELGVNRGNLLRRLGRAHDALAGFDEVLKVAPLHARGRIGRGLVYCDTGQTLKALEDFSVAVQAAPQDAVAHYNLGVVLQELGRLDAAAASFEGALRLQSTHADAWLNLAIVRKALGQSNAALVAVERALRLRENWPQALVMRGRLLQEADDDAGALLCYDRALALRPEQAGVWLTRGDALRKLSRCADAIASYERGLQLEPSHPDARGARFNVGVCQLLLGNLLPGWEGLEWRWSESTVGGTNRPALDRRWSGREDIAGRTILVHHEQGYGDSLQFCRYVPLLAQLGARVVLEVPPTLRPLLRSLSGAVALRSGDDPPASYDWHVPLPSLPRALGTRLDSIPAQIPYLCAPPDRLRAWRERLEAVPATPHRCRIGLAWSGNPMHSNDRQRSIPLPALGPLVLSQRGRLSEWISLQRDLRPDEHPLLARWGVRHFGPQLNDFADTAALIQSIDLVISVDTSIAHLAGATGMAPWILLAYVPDWRWMLERSDTPWYPGARLFRQSAPGDWRGVLEQVAAALDAFVAPPR